MKPNARPSINTSLIVPARRAAPFLNRCFASIAAQTAPPDEILLGVDACRSTLERALPLRAAHAGLRLFWFPEHAGCYRVRNTLAVQASGKYLLFFDADDEMLPCYVAELMRRSRSDTVVRALMVDHFEGYPSGNVQPAHCHACYPRSGFLALGGFEAWQMGADSELLQRWAQSGRREIVTPQPVVRRHVHAGSLTCRPDTGLRSEARRAVRTVIARRRAARQPIVLDTLRTAPFREWI